MLDAHWALIRRCLAKATTRKTQRTPCLALIHPEPETQARQVQGVVVPSWGARRRGDRVSRGIRTHRQREMDFCRHTSLLRENVLRSDVARMSIALRYERHPGAHAMAKPGCAIPLGHNLNSRMSCDAWSRAAVQPSRPHDKIVQYHLKPMGVPVSSMAKTAFAFLASV